MVFCNTPLGLVHHKVKLVTILILIDGFLQYHIIPIYYIIPIVTILILIDGFLQLKKKIKPLKGTTSQSLF